MYGIRHIVSVRACLESPFCTFSSRALSHSHHSACQTVLRMKVSENFLRVTQKCASVMALYHSFRRHMFVEKTFVAHPSKTAGGTGFLHMHYANPAPSSNNGIPVHTVRGSPSLLPHPTHPTHPPTHGHGLWLQEGGKFFICRRGGSDFLSREGVSFCAAGGGKGGGQVLKTKIFSFFNKKC